MPPPEDQPRLPIDPPAEPGLDPLPGVEPPSGVKRRPLRPSLVVDLEQDHSDHGDEVQVPITEASVTASISAPEDPYLGKSFGGYRLEKRIGQGGMGLVYRGRQVSLDRVVAVKILNKALCDNQEFIKRFEREAKSIARINHPNIVAVYDFGVHDALWYMVTEFVEGKSMSVLIGDRLVLPVAEVAQLMIGALAGLDHVGQSGIVHRDIKPDNILITREGVAKIADFGLAKDVTERDDRTDLTAVGLAMGTPAYMSPEQCMGRKLDGRSDQYSLGISAYFALTGQKPFTGQSSFEIMTKQREYIPPPPHQVNPSVPMAISGVIMRMMAKDPADRYGDSATCRQAWIDAGAESAVPLPKLRSGEWDMPGQPTRRNPAAVTSSSNLPPVAMPPDLPQIVHPPSHAAAGTALPQSLPAPPATATAGSGNEGRRASEVRRLSATEQASLRRATAGTADLGEAVPPPPPERTGTDRALSPTDRRSHLVSGTISAVTCAKCGMLNRPETVTCTRCATPLKGGDPLRMARDQEAEANRHLDLGRPREAAAIFARLADQEQDRRTKSVLRAREREARRADLEKQLQERLARGRGLADRGDLKGAINLLRTARELFVEHSAATSSVLDSVQGKLEVEIHDLEERVAGRRRIRWLVGAILVLTLVAVIGYAVVVNRGRADSPGVTERSASTPVVVSPSPAPATPSPTSAEGATP